MLEPKNGRFDIFIAYYGNRTTGSEAAAQRVYELIHDKELIPGKCIQAYFHPKTDPHGSFKLTPDRASRIPMFLLVADSNIPTDEYKAIPQFRNNDTRSNLYEEIHSFHLSDMYDGYRGADQAAKVYITDDMNVKDAERLHVIFRGKEAITSEQKLIEWIRHFYMNTNPERLSAFAKRKAKENRTSFLEGAWLEEVVESWNLTHDERVARTLLIYYISKIESGETSHIKSLIFIGSELRDRSNLDDKTRILLKKAADLSKDMRKRGI